MGFVGAQEAKRRTPSPRPGKSPPPPPSNHQQDRPAKPLPIPSRAPKPDVPPPAPEMNIRNRTSSLPKRDENGPSRSKVGDIAAEFKKVNVGGGRPPKPSAAPPTLHSNEKAHTKSMEGGGRKKSAGPVPSKTVSGWVGHVCACTCACYLQGTLAPSHTHKLFGFVGAYSPPECL